MALVLTRHHDEVREDDDEPDRVVRNQSHGMRLSTPVAAASGDLAGLGRGGDAVAELTAGSRGHPEERKAQKARGFHHALRSRVERSVIR
jgi:hypothetical protein